MSNTLATPSAPSTNSAQNYNISVAGEVLTSACHTAAYDAGWWTNAKGEPLEFNMAEKLMLIVSELGEAMEGHRKGLSDQHLPHRSSLEVELADAVIRIFDLAGRIKLDLGTTIVEKLAYNSTRVDHTRAHREKAGGKAY